MKTHDLHLDADQIIHAVVDADDLITFERNHLLKCPLCQRKEQELEEELKRLGEMSKEMVPLPRRRFIPVAQESQSWFSWQHVLTTGFVIVLLMIGIWWTSIFTRLKENESIQITQEMETSQQLMAEINFIEDYALPDRYLDIIVETNDYYDEEFLEFILPL